MVSCQDERYIFSLVRLLLPGRILMFIGEESHLPKAYAMSGVNLL
jgi:hypothetical protein